MAYADLSTRELEVVQHVAAGLSNREIAVILHCAKRTVDSHVRNAMKKTTTKSRTQLAVHAVKHGLVDCSYDGGA